MQSEHFERSVYWNDIARIFAVINVVPNSCGNYEGGNISNDGGIVDQDNRISINRQSFLDNQKMIE